MHNLVIEAIFTRFPDVKKEYAKLTTDGFEAYQVTYDTLKLLGNESVDITFTNGEVQHRLYQERGLYVGGFTELVSKRVSTQVRTDI